MKSDTTTTVLNFLLVLLAVAGVFCAILDFKRTREFRAINLQAMQDKDLIMRVQNLAGEVNALNQKNPSAALTQILNPPQAKPGSH
jgi:hypothetical protein